MEEIWLKTINNNYLVSNFGRVKRIKRFYNSNGKIYFKDDEYILKPEITKQGYCQVTLYDYDTKSSRRYRIHRLVAEAFIPNPNNYPVVNHKDENPLNNYVDNLEWCSQKYNCNYGTSKDRLSKKLSIKVNQYDLNGNFIKTWESIREASNFYKTKHISCVCKGNRKTCKGFIWKYQ